MANMNIFQKLAATRSLFVSKKPVSTLNEPALKTSRVEGEGGSIEGVYQK
jgi:hypothetical protein